MNNRNNFSNIYSKTKKLHDQLDKHPFLIRYAQDKFTLKDRYRHLCELLPIYEAIEEKMRNCTYGNELCSHNELSEVMERAKLIKEDLDFMREKSGITFTDYPLAQKTSEYISAINKMTDPEEIFAHFYVRILGDFHGGPLTKARVTALFKNRAMYSEDAPDAGVKFYTFNAETSPLFHQWLNNKKLAEKSFDFANQAFKAHLDIFDELEQKRSSSSVIKNFSAFFCSKKSMVVGVSLATVAAVKISYHMR
ncbi:biliverdin-producing heme oxygenase [Aquicella lusitana]|uniref:Heme oxygenase n=1 Tax=Aquicella lusitana TaxID=254246 RepID=A0A370GJI9_9COXI|nr:biliverdin-producing heme oxygenase [Aquicella lusitana]RDI43807.1 heme oxygenase [Aquicella lusitana]VVC74462.1 Heme oxygenase 1 [Aquicella lusitana]